jgi:choline dehydrogenase-like flavoprotein
MTEAADVVIIGSGIAGAMCAWRLASRGVKVLVLEAGPRIERAEIGREFMTAAKLDLSAGYPNPPWAPRPDWGTSEGNGYIRQVGDPVVRAEYLRVVGGTTWHWNGNATRLLPADFRLRSTYGVGVDWPIGYADIEPYYVEAEREMGVAGEDGDPRFPRSAPFPLPPIPPTYADRVIMKRLAPLGFKFAIRPVARNSRVYDDRARCEGFSTCSQVCPSGARYDAIVHVEKAERLGVRVLDNARVDRLEVGPDDRITAAHFARPQGESASATGRIFVLAANGLESPRLLLASANDRFSTGIGNASDQVGRNFMEHPAYLVRGLMPQPIYTGRGPDGTIAWYEPLDGRERSQRAAYDLATGNRVNLHDITVHYISLGLQSPKLDQAIRDHAIREFEIDSQVEQLPSPGNRVTIDFADRDSAGQPRIILHYSLSEYDLLAKAEIYRHFDRIVAALNAKELTRSDFYAHHHLMGTLRMGRDARISVVDEVCRAHDHPNLFIAGSAVFPTAGVANPTLTIAALALRSADAIVRQLSQQ